MTRGILLQHRKLYVGLPFVSANKIPNKPARNMSPSTVTLSDICNAVYTGRVLWKKHALERLLERGISRNQVKSAILHGVIIENYPEDNPIPSFLLAATQPEALHVVLAYDAASEQCHIITAYRPDLTHFEADLITRRLLT